MRTTSTVCKVLMWVFFIVSLFFHVMALFGLHLNNQSAIELNKPASVYNIQPMLIGCVLMLLSVIVFTFLRKGKWIPLCIAVAAGVLLLIVTIDLGNTFTVSIGVDGGDVGLTPWRLVYRHYSMLLTPILMAIAYFTGRTADKEEEAAYNRNYQSQYHFDGAPLFSDEENGEKKKRSVAVRERKSAEQAQRDSERAERNG